MDEVLEKYIRDKNIVKKIHNKEIKYSVGDIVFLFRRKINGHPKVLSENIPYIVKKIESDFVYVDVSKKSSLGYNSNFDYKVNKVFLLPDYFYKMINREEIINKLFN